MTARLSRKGQIVLPKKARSRLHLHPGVVLVCEVKGDSIVLTPENPTTGSPKSVTDPRTGLRITKSAPETKVTSAHVRGAMLDFP